MHNYVKSIALQCFPSMLDLVFNNMIYRLFLCFTSTSLVWTLIDLLLSRMDYYKSLGLGRGINVTDLHMWRNKSAFIVREINGDIIETEECGMFEKYEKIVSTISREQQKIRLSLNDPSSQIKIGMDAEQTQSVTSNIRIAGTKVKTRTISFCTTLDDLPPYVQHLDKPQHIYKPNQEKNSFERTFVRGFSIKSETTKTMIRKRVKLKVNCQQQKQFKKFLTMLPMKRKEKTFILSVKYLFEI